MSRRVLAGLLAIAVVAGAGCGRFARSGSTPETTAAENVAVGGGVDLSKVTTTVAAPGATAPPTTARTTGTTVAAGRTKVAAERDGFRLTLSVDGAEHNADDAFTMKLEVTNISAEDRLYDPNQRTYFVMQSARGSGSWRDSDCAAPKGSGEDAQPIAKGQTITFTARYPGPADRLDNSDSCRRPPNGYVLSAGFVWCPPESIFGGKCDPSASTTLTSEPLGITLR